MQKVYTAQLFTSTSAAVASPDVILKYRFPKTYRHAILDRQLTRQRLSAEARALVRAARSGIAVPSVKCLDLEGGVLGIELVQGKTVREVLGSAAEGNEDEGVAAVHANGHSLPSLTRQLAEVCMDTPVEDVLLPMIGIQIARLHQVNIIHGDLTTSNMMVRSKAVDGENTFEIVLIDFGLSYVSSLLEDKAVDLYVLERAFLSTHPDTDNPLLSNRFNKLLAGYANHLGATQWEPVKRRFNEVRLRGRKRDMTG